MMDWKQKISDLTAHLDNAREHEQDCREFALTEKEKRKCKRHNVSRNYYQQFTHEELLDIYSEAKALYAHKKNVLSLLLISLALAVLFNVWKGTLNLCMNAVQLCIADGLISEQMLSSVLLLVAGLAIIISISIFCTIYLYLLDINRLYRRLLIVEELLKVDSIR